MKKWLSRIIKTVVILYLVVCTLLYFFQEKLIFFPQKLPGGHVFEFPAEYEEVGIWRTDEVLLHGLLFKADRPDSNRHDTSRKLIFYLHGNAGSLLNWGNAALNYTPLGYDVFMLDYRGYGKSEGSISSLEQFYGDIQAAYDQMKQRYPENKIVVLGYSIGTGPAAYLAAHNHPRLLLLHAPYYSLSDMMKHRYPGVPTFLLKYQFDTYEYLQACKMPVTIFHGDSDDVIYYGSSLKLKEHFKVGDTLITLKGVGHSGMGENSVYTDAIKEILLRR